VEQHDRAVGHQGLQSQPSAKLSQVGFSGHPKPQVPPHLGLVIGSCLGSLAVACQRAWIDAKLLGKEPHRARRGVGHVVGTEPQHPQPTQLECPTKAVAATVTSAYFGQIGIVEREELVESFRVEI
jgi:hypothetical protein